MVAHRSTRWGWLRLHALTHPTAERGLRAAPPGASQGKKLTQEELAERADLGVNIVGRLERAVIAPGLVSILKLSVALGVPAKELLDPFTPDVVLRMKVAPSPTSKSRR